MPCPISHQSGKGGNTPHASNGNDVQERKLELDRSSAALAHVRSMHLWAADSRMKNFNFYIVIMAAIFAGMGREPGLNVIGLFSGVGLFVSVVFFVLDCRVFQLLLDTRKDLESLEKTFGTSLHKSDHIPARGEAKVRIRIVSHTFMYRGTLVASAVMWIVLGIIAYMQM